MSVLLGLGKIRVEMKDFASARKYFEEVLKLRPAALTRRKRKKRYENRRRSSSQSHGFISKNEVPACKRDNKKLEAKGD
jgi:cytochrome c-type biogenesis protein CcmH/NrfG